MEKLNSLKNLFVHEIQDLYSAELQLTKALPKVAAKATSPELKNAVEEHLAQTEEHVSRLEQVFHLLGEEPTELTCKAMKGLIKEAKDILKEEASPETRDAAIIAAAQKVEHYEIASYGTVAKWADVIGRNDIKQLLGQTLDEEEKADRRLSELAEAGINQRAAAYRAEEKELTE